MGPKGVPGMGQIGPATRRPEVGRSALTCGFTDRAKLTDPNSRIRLPSLVVATYGYHYI